ncbi:MAG: ARMT1-like domain-containing protein [Candidatus Poribacteria bacterium]|nr:ARMT1-like domain-containing protein [Candidatus Poribacteria bacterium]
MKALDEAFGFPLTETRPDIAKQLASALSAETPRLSSEDIRRRLSIQWVVLAAGKGSRIDPTGRFNKNMDLWFGTQNALQRVCRNLPGRLPPLAVVSPAMARRVLKKTDGGEPLSGLIDEARLDVRLRDRLFGEGAPIAVQPAPNGPGGALMAAEAFLRASEAELAGVLYGDEPFAPPRAAVETLAAFICAGADAALCGKRPETVVGKGAMLFDKDGRFRGTLEWREMKPEEQERMRALHAQNDAVTNAGVSVFRRERMLELLGSLWLHNGTEYHHTDLFRLFYERGFKTHAHIYEGFIPSGVNRWTNVLDGETALFEQARRRLAEEGVRALPDAQAHIVSGAAFGVGCAVSGKIVVEEKCGVGGYVHLSDAVLEGETSVGDRARVRDSRLRNASVDACDDGSPVGTAIDLLHTLTNIDGCSLENVVVGRGCQLQNVQARFTVLPPNLRLRNRRLGVWRDPSLGLPYEDTPALYRLVLESYLPGVFTFADRKHEPDWEKLRAHVRRMSVEELAPRLSRSEETQRMFTSSVHRLLDAQFEDKHLIDPLTPEELWGVVYELARLCSGNPDPYAPEKRASRNEADRLFNRMNARGMEWQALLRAATAANLIDYSSARMTAAMRLNPNLLAETLEEAQSKPFAIDSFKAFERLLLNGDRRRVLWLTDNDGEIVFDMEIVRRLAAEGHHVEIAARSSAAGNDMTASDLSVILGGMNLHIGVMGSGSRTAGTNLFQASARFAHALQEADVVVSKGQGNWYTTQGLRKDRFYMLMSKGMTAERTTGVSAEGLILAHLSAGAGRGDQPLIETAQNE